MEPKGVIIFKRGDGKMLRGYFSPKSCILRKSTTGISIFSRDSPALRATVRLDSLQKAPKHALWRPQPPYLKMVASYLRFTTDIMQN